MAAKTRIVVLGAGFGGLELCTLLSENASDRVDVTLIDKSDAFSFGFSKLDIMFRGENPAYVSLPYDEFVKPGVRLRQETILAIDPNARRVTTNAGTYEGDVLVIALGSDYDVDATPGLRDSHEFYTLAGAARLAEIIPTIAKGRILVGACGSPYKCPPAPSETVLMLHDFLSARGVRGACEIALALPLATPVPPSPETSRALLAAFEERAIAFYGDRDVVSLDARRGIATLEDGTEIPYDLFMGVPKQRAPQVVAESGLVENGYVPVDFHTLETRVPGVYAIGDCAMQGTPKAGVFAEGAARALAALLIAKVRGEETAAKHLGRGSCYIEFGAGRIGRVDIDFLSGPKPTGTYHAPSEALRADKNVFGSSRRARWFGRPE